MLETRCSTYKMMKSVALEERQINLWPPPFSSGMTPNIENDFSEAVKNACIKQNLTLRISKVIVIGDMLVGKTSLVNRFCHKSFNNNYKATIGVDFEVERFDVLGIPFNLQIWDTAGQERFKCIAASYYRAAHAIIVVFDLGNLISLSHSVQWLAEAARCNTGTYKIFLVGTKRDLLSQQVYDIIERRSNDFASKMRAEYWAVSSKTGDGVMELFTRVAALCFNSTVLQELEIASRESIDIGSKSITLKRPTRETEDKNRPFSHCLRCKI